MDSGNSDDSECGGPAYPHLPTDACVAMSVSTGILIEPCYVCNNERPYYVNRVRKQGLQLN